MASNTIEFPQEFFDAIKDAVYEGMKKFYEETGYDCKEFLFERMERRRTETIRDDNLTGREVSELLESRKPYYQICKEAAERM